jgi:23S rRNA (uracil1939-C5)-methyltransferase
MGLGCDRHRPTDAGAYSRAIPAAAETRFLAEVTRAGGSAEHSGAIVELAVERIGARGDGIAHYQGEPVFVPFTVPGDRVRARLGARRYGGRECLVIDRVVSGPGRAPPRCRHFETCGGCQLQHLDAVTYQCAKLEMLHAALDRVGIDPGVVAPLRLVSPQRRRARLAISRPNNPGLAARVGYRERLRHHLVDLYECPVLEPEVFALIGRLRRISRELVAPGGSAETMLTRTDSGIDLLIETPKRPSLAVCEALAQFAEQGDLARIVWRSARQDIVIVERRPVRILRSGVTVSFPPGAFLQASAVAEGILVDEVLSAVNTSRPTADLFAGLGTFAFALACRGPVHAVEGEALAAAALARAAAVTRRVTVERRDLARNPLPPEALAPYAAAVFDPPRAGAARQAEALAASAIETVVAISCDPATFARDAAKLVGGGYSTRTGCARRSIRLDASSRARSGIPTMTHSEGRSEDSQV